MVFTLAEQEKVIYDALRAAKSAGKNALFADDDSLQGVSMNAFRSLERKGVILYFPREETVFGKPRIRFSPLYIQTKGIETCYPYSI